MSFESEDRPNNKCMFLFQLFWVCAVFGSSILVSEVKYSDVLGQRTSLGYLSDFLHSPTSLSYIYYVINKRHRRTWNWTIGEKKTEWRTNMFSMKPNYQIPNIFITTISMTLNDSNVWKIIKRLFFNFKMGEGKETNHINGDYFLNRYS